MNLLLIGQSLEDHILSNGKEEVKPGGIFYSVLGMQSIMDKDDKITLCTTVDKENIELFYPVYKDLDKQYFQDDPDLPKVFLNINGKEEREECYSKVSKSLQFEIENPDRYDGILINMITGFDINIDQLEKLRSVYKGLICFDVHTLARGIDKEGKRDFRTIPDFNSWAKNIDILQVNEREFFTLYKSNNESEIVQRLFSGGIKILIITKAEKGAKIFYKIKGETAAEYRSAIKVSTKNKVGCGDVFGAVFFYSYISSLNAGKALKTATIAAGLAASYDKMENYLELKEDVYTRSG
ncbi:MAG TPA: carbohydrate kinase family protein [Ignavibacteriaceae bacterium]|nr:carbohydrate kinase family protein [Ignavibacteriaceae bacterium]